MIIIEPGSRLTTYRNGKECEIYFHTIERAKEVLDFVRKNSGEDYPSAEIILKSEYWKWPQRNQPGAVKEREE